MAYPPDNLHKLFQVMWMKNRKFLAYAIAILIPEAVGALAGLLTREGIQNFQNVPQSALTPPGIVFPIVWTILYALMGISLARVWMAEESMDRIRGLSLFLFQLIFNFFWSIFFFNMGAYGFSFLWILGLWVLIGLMILSFYKVERFAAWLQAPYFLWVTFAAYLNYAVWQLNK